MERNKVNPQMIILAREYRGITQEELANKIGVSQGFLSKIEKSILQVRKEILSQLTTVLDLPVEFFTRNGNVFSPNLYYRKRLKTSPKILMKSEAEMNIHRLNIQELLQSVDLDSKSLPLLDIEEHGDPKTIAQKVRQFWHMPKGTINNLFELLEKNGIIIVFCDFESTDIDGRSMFTDNKQPIIFINKNRPVDRQRFTVSHELAHLVMHIGFSVPEERDIETEANIFASEFLIPESELRKQIHGYLRISDLADLKRYWRASMAAIAFSASKNGIITPNNYKSILIEINKLGFRIKEPVELEPPKEKTLLLPTLLKMHLNDLEFSDSELAKILGFSVEEMKEKYFEDETPKKLRAIIW